MAIKKSIFAINGFILCISLIFFAILTTGCEKQGAQAIFVVDLTNWGQSAKLVSSPIADVYQSDVIIKWDTLSHIFPYKELELELNLRFQAYLDLDTLKDYTVELISDVGYCEGTVTMPEGISIIEPTNNDTLSPEEIVTVTWSTAGGADWYQVVYFLYAYDSAGSVLYWDRTAEHLTDTSLTLPAELFDIPDAVYYSVEVTVCPCSGVMPVPGETGNMSGSVNGFLVARNLILDPQIEFYVGEPIVGQLQNIYLERNSAENDIINDYFDALDIEIK